MIRKATALMVYLFGVLGIFTAIFFYTQPNSFGNIMQRDMLALYDFFLYYFIVSGAISFFIVGIGGAMCVSKKLSFRDAGPGIILNLISLTCYIFFGVLA